MTLLLSYTEMQKTLLPWLLSEKHPPWLLKALQQHWAAARDNMALTPASQGLAAALKPRIPETLNMGNELSSLHSFCADTLKCAEKLPMHMEALELEHTVRFQKVNDSGEGIDRADNAICSKQKVVSYKATVLNANCPARGALVCGDI